MLVTGCGSGFGRQLARRWLAAGAEVVATDLDTTGLHAALTEGVGGDLTVVPLDLAEPASIASVVDAAGPVDVLVNNAGYAVFASQGEADFDAIDRQFRANVVGTARLTAGLLPVLRARRGLVVQLSSIAGRMVFPASGFYAATKHALEALSEALYLENLDAGLRVIVIQPGNFLTSFQEHARAHSQASPASSPWSASQAQWDAFREAILHPGQPAELVVDAVFRAIDDPRPFQRVAVGVDAAAILAMRDALGPEGWVHAQAARLGHPGAADPIGSPDDPATTREARLALLRLAAVGGFLNHWEDSEAGREAVRRLKEGAR